MRDFGNRNQRTERAIKSRTVLLIDKDGSNLGVLDTLDAYRMAESSGLDLVQVGEGKNGIPTCKIMDLGKWKYEQSKRHKASKATQQLTKEIKIRPNTDDHDLEYRAKQALEFIGEGDRVKIVVRFKGREKNHMTETGRDVLERFVKLLDETKYKVEKAAEIGDKDISIMLVPAK